MNRRELIAAVIAVPIAAALPAPGPETITVRLRMRDDLSARLAALAKRFPETLSAALHAEGERIMAQAKRDHPLPWPVPEGHLLGSRMRPRGAVGVGGERTPYAAAFHE